MFLPKSKYTIKHASWGMFQLSGSAPGEFYVGPYIEDYLGRTYAGSDITTAQDRVLYKASDQEESKKAVVGEVDLNPSEEAYVSGSYVRYFRQNKYTKVIEEITETRIEDEGPWKIISGTWILTGSLDDIMISGYPYRGVCYRNGQTLLKLEGEMPGLLSALNITADQFVKES